MAAGAAAVHLRKDRTGSRGGGVGGGGKCRVTRAKARWGRFHGRALVLVKKEDLWKLEAHCYTGPQLFAVPLVDRATIDPPQALDANTSVYSQFAPPLYDTHLHRPLRSRHQRCAFPILSAGPDCTPSALECDELRRPAVLRRYDQHALRSSELR